MLQPLLVLRLLLLLVVIAFGAADFAVFHLVGAFVCVPTHTSAAAVRNSCCWYCWHMHGSIQSFDQHI
jgi:hypothetical protein